ncbi:hypothetical protein EV363DRAFT_1455306 [Boletus edulis]|nr:hypothetical protein EV363DRAFT_1455306 [Boletus edulis]
MHNHSEAGLQEVEVDQRALVNILSRYPGEFDVLRELIQNADDAEAPTVEVHFQTGEVEKPQSTAESIEKLNVRKWIIRNEGSFRESDWERLGKIGISIHISGSAVSLMGSAAGNNDATKVGAFGVGFYSVLSKSDRPIVKSGGKSLQFCRRKDGKLCKQFADSSTDSWTSVELELRDPEPLPGLADLTRFLVSSVAFLTNIHTIAIFLDDQRLVHIQKESRESPVDTPISQHLMRTTASHILTVESIQRIVQRITIDTAEWAFASSSTSSLLSEVSTADCLAELSGYPVEDHSVSTSSTEVMWQENAVTYDLYTATTRVNLQPDSEMKRGVESSMKSLPSSFKCKAVYLNSEQSDRLVRINKSHLPKTKHFARLLFGPHGIVPENSGRLFIGQSTSQTTGIGLHVSAHFLPTMERGSIDLANGQVAAWNKEVLWVSGFLARVIYEEEMHVAAGSKGELATQLGLRTMARFYFRPTFPHSEVSQILQDAFFACSHELKSPFLVVSNVGISDASDPQFRVSNKDLLFLKRYLVLHEEIEQHQHSEIVTRYKIRRFSSGDIIEGFASGVTEDVMKAFFAWWEEANRDSLWSVEAKAKFCKKFASRGVLLSSHGAKTALKNIKYFTFFSLPDNLSPPDNIYVNITLGVPSRVALECFGWVQLSLLGWLEYACAHARASNGDPDVNHHILRVLVQFALVEELSLPQWNRVADLMKDIKCIPTNMGLRVPAESYFDEADICRDLPVAKEEDFQDVSVTYVADPGGFRYTPATASPQHIRKVLISLGVRQTMEWKEMIDRLETAASEDSNDRLLRFLVFAYRGKLTDERINDLERKRVFYSQNHGRVSAAELHFPSEDMHKLGLPTLTLPRNSIASLQNTVDPSFAMEPFIESLGIQRYPTLSTIIGRAASNKPEVQQPALQYFLLNLQTRYDDYKPDDFVDVAFIPTINGSLARPNEVFASSVWEKLGFKQASETLHRDFSRLGVKDDPSVDVIIEYLKTPERTLPDIETAKIWFEHLSLYGKFPILKLRERFSTIPFVLAKSPGPSYSEPSSITYFPPKDCFIASPDMKEHYRNIFPIVDFGQTGNSFLESCCAKKSPDASDMARKIVEDPRKYLTALGNDTKLYLEDLRTVALRLDSISEDDKKAMQGAPMFLAFRQCMDGSELLPAYKVVISDWESRDFGDTVFLAPKDDAIEKMYHKMGSQFLGTYVKYEIIHAGTDDKYKLPFNRDQVIQRIRCFMRQRDKSERTDVVFYDEGSTVDFRVRACKTLTMKKTFAPPFGVLADGIVARSRETQPIQVKAGFEFGESYTLWLVKGFGDSVGLRNDIAVALCRVLLTSFGPNDVLLLASLIAMDDKSLESYYGSEMKPELLSAPAVQGNIVDGVFRSD